MTLFALLSLTALRFQASAVPVLKPAFQADFFGEMPRAFSTILKVDARTHTLTVQTDQDGKVHTVPIRDDTEIHFRDSWGELSDYFPGQHVMLFLYVDEAKNWTYPRAVQDDIHVSARHGWFARVTRIDQELQVFHTRREEKNSKGEVTRVIEANVPYAEDVRIWKGDTPGGIETLAIGDEVIQQLVMRKGTLRAAEIFDRKGDDAVRAMQDAKHRQDQDRLGLPAYINDIDPVSGSLLVTVAWSGAERARELKPGQTVALVPAASPTLPFAGAISSMEAIDSRERIQFVVNARAASRLAIGDSLRLFLPRTGPTIPIGRAGVPGVRR